MAESASNAKARIEEGFSRFLGGGDSSNVTGRSLADIAEKGQETPEISPSENPAFVDYDENYDYEGNGWVGVQGYGGQMAYIEPEKVNIAIPKTYNHPVLNRNIDSSTAKKLAADTIEQNKKQAARTALKERDAAKAKQKEQPATTEARETQVETDEAAAIKTPAAAAVDAAMPAASMAAVAPVASAPQPQFAMKFHVEEGNAAPAQAPSSSAQLLQDQDFVDAVNSGNFNVAEDVVNSSTANAAPSGQTFNKKFSAEEPSQQSQSTSSAGTKSTPGPTNATGTSNATNSSQGSEYNAGPSQAANQPAAAQAVNNALSEREQIDQIKKQEYYDAVKDARAENRRIDNREKKAWREANHGRPMSEFTPSGIGHNSEAFEDSLGSAMKEHWGEDGAPTDNLPGRTERDETKKWRLLDKVNYAFQLGFFHIGSEKLTYDEKGNPVITYSIPVSRIMKAMRDTFGLSGKRGDRTIFRMVMMYASMSVDRQGKMFNEDASEWSMTDDDFVRICQMIMDSAYNNHGNPMVMPHKSEKLGGTDIYPCGVMPKVVADVLINPRNQTISGNMRQSDLIQMCQDEWTSNTYPRMQARLAEGMKPPKRRKGKETGEYYKVGPFKIKQYKTDEYKQNLAAQKIVVENFAEALARLDGLKLEDFSERYRVDTSMHYTYEEYKDSNKVYAQAMNGKYDADMVLAREKAKEKAWDNRLKSGRYYTVKHPDGYVEIAGVRHDTSLGAGMRVATKLIRANALFLQVPIMIGQIAEHGIGNFQTNVTLHAMLGRQSSYKISDAAHERLHSSEFVEAMSAVKLLMELLGPGGCRLFAKEGKPYTIENVTAFARRNYMSDSSSEKMRDVESWLSRATDKVMTGDIGFKKSDNTNWWLGSIVSNDRRRRNQSRLAEGEVDKYGIAFTPEELEDMLLHQDPGSFLAEMMGSDAGIDGFLLMRGNNVGNVNLISYNVNQVLREHGFIDGLITIFVDNFPKYGINLILSMLPFSKTATYVLAKWSGNKNIATDSDLVIGGNIGAFLGGENGKWYEDEGLRMNLWYDSIMFGRQVLIMPVLVGAIMAILGYEPPEDKRNLFNPSMWTIGGVELNQTFWMNDITLMTLPISCAIACVLSGNNDKDLGQGDKNLAVELLRSSLYEQLDGNVVLDCVNILKNWQVDIAELKQMAEDPNYESEIITPSAGTMLAQEYLLTIANKLTPGAPIYRAAANSSIIRGRDANAIAYNKVFDRSDEWHRENNISKYINDPYEILMRQNSAKNWLLAMILNTREGTWFDQNKTGHLWWEMPTRSAGDPMDYIFIDMFKIDYDRREINPETGELESYKEYEDRMAQFLLDYISQFESPQEAIRDKHIIIPSEIKYFAIRYLGEQKQFLQDDLDARIDAGDFPDDDTKWRTIRDVNAQKTEINRIIREWLNNDDIPEWTQSYDINITNWETTFFNVADNSPASPWDYLTGKPGVDIAFIEKGDIPNNLLPFTVVENWGGANKETVNYWRDENTDMGYIDSLLVDPETGEDRVIPMGRDQGKTYREVLYGGEQPPGQQEFTNYPDSTTGHRSWKPKENKTSQIVRDLADRVIHEVGQIKSNNDDDNGGSGSPTYWPRSTYGGYSGSSRSSYSGGYPKIYSTRISMTHPNLGRIYANSRINNTHLSNSRVSNTHVSNTRLNHGNIGSTRTNPDARSVNNDRASSIGTRSPQSGKSSTYLNPNFETKGSREAYKRQDI